MYTFAAIFTFAMAVSALTARDVESSQCGNTGKVSCCNPSTNSQAASGLLALAGLDSIAGGTCQQVPLDVLAVPLSGAGAICGGNQVYCCEDVNTNQNGLINLSTTCSPLDLGGLI